MGTMYSSGRGRYKKRKVKTVFIGRNFLVILAIIMVIIPVAASVCVLGVSLDGELASLFRRELVISAFPAVAAGCGRDAFALEKAVSNFFPGTAFEDSRLNFRVIPALYGINRIEPGVAVSGRDYAYLTGDDSREEYTVPPEAEVSEETSFSRELKLKNETTYTIDAEALASQPCDIALTHREPEILIVHTHASESYTRSDKYRHSESDYARCQDIRYNVVRVGEELASELKKRGFCVIHDKTINDYPSYNKSYTKTLGVIESYLKEYPSIKCVFDVHRDAIVKDDGTRVKFTADVCGEKVSQIMIVCGSDLLGLENPHWEKNLSTALKIQKVLNEKYPGLMRPVNLRKERFNLHKTTGSFIFEFGTHGNTLDEALASVKYFAEGIEAVLK